MNASVWCSDIAYRSTYIMPLTADISVEAPDIAAEASRLNKKGQPVDADRCPKRIWMDKDGASKGSSALPKLFYANGYWVVSGAAAAVLRGFDLGSGALYPVGMFKSDRVTPLPGDYFCWTFGNQKSAFLEAQSPAAPEMAGVGRSLCELPWVVKDDDIAVSCDALGTPDVWVDTGLFNSVFFSGHLAEALIAAGLKDRFRLFRCRVV